MVSEIIHTHPQDGHLKFQGERGLQQPKFLKESMKQNWKFQGGWELSSNQIIILGGGMDIFWSPTLTKVSLTSNKHFTKNYLY